MTFVFKRGVVWATALVAASAFSLSACGTESDAGAGGDSTSVDFMVTSTALSAVPVDVAISSDVFAKHGIAMEYQQFQGASASAISAVMSGSGEFGTAGGTAALDAIHEGAPLQLIANIEHPATIIVVRKDIAKKIKNESGVTPSSPIAERVRALKGLTVATNPPGSTHDTMFRAMAAEYGVNAKKDLSLVASTQNAVVAGVKAGKFDAAQWSAGTLEKNIQDGDAVQWISFTAGEVPSLKNLLYMVAFTKTSTAKEKPELVKKFVSALRDSANQFEENPESVVPAMKKEFFPKLDDSTWEASWKPVQKAIVKDLVFTEDGYNRTVELQGKILNKDYENMTYEKVVAKVARR